MRQVILRIADKTDKKLRTPIKQGLSTVDFSSTNCIDFDECPQVAQLALMGVLDWFIRLPSRPPTYPDNEMERVIAGVLGEQSCVGHMQVPDSNVELSLLSEGNEAQISSTGVGCLCFSGEARTADE